MEVDGGLNWRKEEWDTSGAGDHGQGDIVEAPEAMQINNNNNNINNNNINNNNNNNNNNNYNNL